MSVSQSASLARTVYEAYNDRDFERAANVVTDDFEFTVIPTGQAFKGPAGMRDYLQMWAAGFPDSRAEISNVVSQESGATVEFRGHGTHTGTLMTPMGDIPATGRSAELNFADVYEVRDDKLARGRTYFDMASLMRQLGLME
jgi:steroid delta-isomerase-like uncharacterized protein